MISRDVEFRSDIGLFFFRSKNFFEFFIFVCEKFFEFLEFFLGSVVLFDDKTRRARFFEQIFVFRISSIGWTETGLSHQSLAMA